MTCPLALFQRTNCAAVVFCHQDQLPDLLGYLNGGFHRFALLHWIKPNPSPMANKHYLADTEPFIHAWNRGYHPQGVHHDKHRHVTAGTTPSKRYGHPTVKPAEVMNKIMRNVAGETVCDSFMGTGSTGIAALLHRKRFFGIEKNPTHIHTAAARITDVWQRIGTEAS
jgi:site-specific DNA-methyltransferase (adenine-specific)